MDNKLQRAWRVGRNIPYELPHCFGEEYKATIETKEIGLIWTSDFKGKVDRNKL